MKEHMKNVLAIRCVNSTDGMTADWSHLPHELLGKISSDINHVKGINRVVYDISPNRLQPLNGNKHILILLLSLFLLPSCAFLQDLFGEPNRKTSCGDR